MSTNNPEAADKVQNVVNLAERSLKQNLAARHPHLLRVDKEADIQNEQVIDRIFLENVQASGWEFNDQNYEAAYSLALANGQLVLPEPGAVETNPDDMVIYSDGLRQDADGRIVNPPATEEEVMAKLSTPQLAEYLERKYQAPATINLADALTGEGSYRWKKAREWDWNG
jgi:hypothetical protein